MFAVVAVLLLGVAACIPEEGTGRCLAEEGTTGFGATPSPLAPVPPVDLEGDLDKLVDHFVQTMPAGVVGPRLIYDVPDQREVNRFRRGFACVQQGFLDLAGAVLQSLNYEVVKFKDKELKREFIVMREKEPRRHHWGIFITDRNSPSSLAVEVSHPCPDRFCQQGDLFTHLVGVEAFLKVQARHLFITGAVRDANGRFSPDPNRPNACRRRPRVCSDAAHNPSTMFHRIHQTANPRLVYQPHAFSYRDHPDLKIQEIDVVVSNGRARWRDDALSAAVFNALKKTGEFGVCRFEGEASKCNPSGLKATDNVQAIFTNRRGRSFISVEAEMREIGKGDRLELLAETVACAMTPAPGCLQGDGGDDGDDAKQPVPESSSSSGPST